MTAAALAFLCGALGALGLGGLLAPRWRTGGRPPARLIRLLAAAGHGAGARAPGDLAARIAAAGRPAGLGARELMAELGSPGFVASLAGSFLTAWLAGLALALQVAAAILIRRLGRVRA